MINYFILFFGIIQIIIAFVEVFMPYKSFLTWKVWISCRYFPLHGAALIAAGLPLTAYNGYLSSIIFFIGIVVVFTGPVILLYPEKIREAFSFSSETLGENGVKKIVRFDALMRLAAGMILLVSFYKS